MQTECDFNGMEFAPISCDELGPKVLVVRKHRGADQLPAQKRPRCKIFTLRKIINLFRNSVRISCDRHYTYNLTFSASLLFIKKQKSNAKDFIYFRVLSILLKKKKIVSSRLFPLSIDWRSKIEAIPSRLWESLVEWDPLWV